MNFQATTFVCPLNLVLTFFCCGGKLLCISLHSLTHTHTHTQFQPHWPPSLPKLSWTQGETPPCCREHRRFWRSWLILSDVCILCVSSKTGQSTFVWCVSMYIMLTITVYMFCVVLSMICKMQLHVCILCNIAFLLIHHKQNVTGLLPVN